MPEHSNVRVIFGDICQETTRVPVDAMNAYQVEQLDSLLQVQLHLNALPRPERLQLLALCEEYLAFRGEVDAFLAEYFSRVCDSKCYQSRLSACCSREGIITYFADVVINLLLSDTAAAAALAARLRSENRGFKCIYLGEAGCLWRLKPIVCQMFLCEPSRAQVFSRRPEAAEGWQALETRRKRFTWPDRPVVFDRIEKFFMAAGLRSPLMYLNTSPGLLRVKQRAGIEG
jgi:hypothetical protein